jgi:hypothetical protein
LKKPNVQSETYSISLPVKKAVYQKFKMTLWLPPTWNTPDYKTALVIVRYLNGIEAIVSNLNEEQWMAVNVDMESASSIPFATSTSILDPLTEAAEGQAKDKALEILLRKASAVAGPVIEEAEGSPTAHVGQLFVRVRSVVSVTVYGDGAITVRNHEGSPEVIQPDGSVLSLPVGYESTSDQSGTFASPSPYDPSDPSVSVWGEYVPKTNAEPPRTVSDGNGNENGNGDGTLLAVVVIAVLALSGAALLARRRRGTRPSTPTSLAPPIATRTGTQAPLRPPPPEMKFCINCGSQLLTTNKFCTKCGAQQ